MESKYPIIVVWSEEDAAFLAKVPALPCVMADGETAAQAVERVQEFVAEHLRIAQENGAAVPAPVTYDQFEAVEEEQQRQFLEAVQAEAERLVREGQQTAGRAWHRIGATGREIDPVFQR
jgi:predicted RNase H-like HicB family nuclease